MPSQCSKVDERAQEVCAVDMINRRMKGHETTVDTKSAAPKRQDLS